MVGGEGVDRHHCSVKLSRANGSTVNDLLSILSMRGEGENISPEALIALALLGLGGHRPVLPGRI